MKRYAEAQIARPLREADAVSDPGSERKHGYSISVASCGKPVRRRGHLACRAANELESEHTRLTTLFAESLLGIEMARGAAGGLWSAPELQVSHNDGARTVPVDNVIRLVQGAFPRQDMMSSRSGGPYQCYGVETPLFVRC
jgi:hypothetical protein